MSDEMLRALAQNGGVAGVNFGASFLNQKDADELKQEIARRNALEPNLTGAELDKFAAQQYARQGESHPHVGNATVEDAAACIDHLVKALPPQMTATPSPGRRSADSRTVQGLVAAVSFP
jgi:microsomal dipeptidase-like Zn-dependent dipeptidase